MIKKLVTAALVGALFGLGFVGAQAQRQQTIEDVQRRAFLAGAACGWHPALDRWVFDKIDRTDPDWEEAYQAWRKAEP